MYNVLGCVLKDFYKGLHAYSADRTSDYLSSSESVIGILTFMLHIKSITVKFWEMLNNNIL